MRADLGVFAVISTSPDDDSAYKSQTPNTKPPGKDKCEKACLSTSAPTTESSNTASVATLSPLPKSSSIPPSVSCLQTTSSSKPAKQGSFSFSRMGLARPANSPRNLPSILCKPYTPVIPASSRRASIHYPEANCLQTETQPVTLDVVKVVAKKKTKFSAPARSATPKPGKYCNLTMTRLVVAGNVMS